MTLVNSKIVCLMLVCFLASKAFSVCPPDSIFKDIHLEVEPHKSVTVDISTEVPYVTSCVITQRPKRGFAVVSGSNLTYTSTNDACRRDTIIGQVSTGAEAEYVRYIVHVRARTGGEGTDFWVAFMDNHAADGGNGITKLDITAAQEAHVHISIPFTTYSHDVVVPANSLQTVTNLGVCLTSELIENKGIHITSDVPISVVAGSYSHQSTDATALLPTCALSTEYTIMHQDELNKAEICIVGTQPGTQVTIVPTVNTVGGKPAGVPFTCSIDSGATYLIQANDNYKTFAGTTIRANKPIAVFEGSVCTNYPQEYGACDHNYEQCLPYKFWGKRYVYARLSAKRDYYKLYSRFDDNVISHNGEYLTTLQAGQSYTNYIFDDVGYFEGTKSFAFAQYMAGFDINGVGDPAIINVRPLEAGIDYALFNIPRGVALQSDSLTKVNIIAQKDVYSGITIDGNAVHFEQIVDYDSIYYATIMGLSFGLHSIQSALGTFIATCSAVTEYESYCFHIAPAVEGVRDTLVRINASICANQTYDFHGRCLDKTGIYYDTLYSINWRDSIVELHLTVNSSFEFITDTVMTYWSVLDWRNHHLINIVHDTLIIDSMQTQVSGCDSVYVLNLTAQCAKVDTIIKDTAVCANDWPYKWHTYRNTLIYEAGSHLDSLRGYKCDSMYYILNIQKLRTDSTDTTAYACPDNLPFIWHEHSISAEGDYSTTLTNSANCDSVVTLHFYIINICEPTKPINPTIDCIDTTYSITDTTIYCDSILWFDKWYYTSGTFYDTCYGCNSLQCDSIGTLILKVLDTSTTEDTTAYICHKDLPFIWHGKEAKDGDTIMRKNINGCDSIITLKLITLRADTMKNTASVCAGHAYVWKRDRKADSLIYVPGNYADTVRYIETGCDSMIYCLILTIDDINRDSIAQSTCQGTPYFWRGQDRYIDSVYRDTARAKTSTECDTVYILKLTVNPTYNVDTFAMSCGSFIWYGQEYTISGDYSKTFTTTTGCDSIVTLHLTIHQPTTGDTTAYTCYGTPFIWHGKEAKDGDTIIRKNAQGCDSVVTLKLYTSKAPASQSFDTIVCDTLMPYIWRGRIYEKPAVFKDTLYNKYGCDSIYRSFSLDTIHCVRPEPPVPPDPPEPECGDSLVYRKWDDVLFCDDGLRQFIAYQWYRNEKEITGETKQYLYLPNGQMGDASYGVVATRRDGTMFISCSKPFYNWPRSADTYVQVQTVVRRGNSLHIKMSDEWAEIELYSMIGQQVMKTTIVGSSYALPISLPTGTYVLRLKSEQVNTITKIMVE